MRVLTRKDVESLLDLDQLVDALAEAMTDVSSGSASLAPRVAAFVPDVEGMQAAMPGYVPTIGILETKLVSVFPHNERRGLPSHQAVIVAFDPETGTPQALMDATYITAVRTAAGSALSARLLARENAAVLAIVGTGVQARAHCRAIPRVRSIAEIRIAGRDREKVERLVEEMRPDVASAVREMPSAQEAVDGADIVCATTHASSPVIDRQWLSPGVHVTSVGVNRDGPEIDAATVADALVVVESREAALAPYPAGATDLMWPIRDGVITPDHIHAELGELVTGARPGRTSDDQITLYKSVGIAAEDAAAAALVLRAAQEKDAGTEVAL
ncbi:MAG: ornithine cyclodeaminase family protein [Actinomycetota bacterium]|nr:ornithine cyclodeaminase family protein [Actinomycetota bacterium]